MGDEPSYLEHQAPARHSSPRREDSRVAAAAHDSGCRLRRGGRSPGDLMGTFASPGNSLPRAYAESSTGEARFWTVWSYCFVVRIVFGHGGGLTRFFC